jgi:chromate transporter
MLPLCLRRGNVIDVGDGSASMNSPGTRPSLPIIGCELLRLGAVAFGGLGATLALLQGGMVERRKWLQPSDIAEALAFTKALPGSTGMQVVAYLGWRLHGWPGALVASLAFITPAAAFMIAVAAGSLMLPDAPWVRGAVTGIQVAVVGLLIAAMIRLARSEAKGLPLGCVLAASCVLGFLVPAALVVVGAGLLGAALNGRRPSE